MAKKVTARKPAARKKVGSQKSVVGRKKPAKKPIPPGIPPKELDDLLRELAGKPPKAKPKTQKPKPAAKKTTAKSAAKKRVTKSAAAPKKTTVKRTVKRATSATANQKSKIKNRKLNGLSGRPSPATRQVAKAVKTAKKEGEKAAQKKLVIASKAKMEKVLKGSKEKINKLLKQSNERITKILRDTGAKRKTASQKPPPERIESPFDMRRFRGRRGKKETAKQRLKRLSNAVEAVQTVRDQVLLFFATGGKLKWESVKKETGWGSGERKAILSMLDNKKGYTLKALAERIWESNDGKGRFDDYDILNEVIDVLSTVSSAGAALNELDRRLGGDKTPF